MQIYFAVGFRFAPLLSGSLCNALMLVDARATFCALSLPSISHFSMR